MPGTIVFRPIEANITHSTDFLSKMSPYCAFVVGNKRINSQISKHGGKHPHWSDTVSVPYTNESKIMVELMDKDKITKDDHIGSFMIDLPEIEAQGQSSRWYPLYFKNKPAGEILMEASVQGSGTGLGTGSGLLGSQGFAGATNIQQGPIVNQPVPQQEILTQQKHVEGARTFTEQRQTVEPHTFIKEVDVVETRPHQQTIEVMEPRKVVKDVQYTQAVPVKRQIETVEPQVITKEVEVMEPRLVTKTIQVVENIPVKKQIEVIESVPIMREVETFEPQTFTKQVEITEQVPVMKTVTVTEPVHLKKTVEFVEPIITTQTITKEIRPEVIVNEEVTKSVGPATYIGEFRELSQRFGQITLTEQERARYLAMSEQERLKLSEEERWRWHEARRVSEGGYDYGQFGGRQFHLSEQDRLRYMNMSDNERLALKGDELLRWQEAQRLSGQGSNFGGSQFTGNQFGGSQFSGNQFGGSQYGGNRSNLSEQDRLRYMNMSDKERLALKGDELLRWQEAQRLSGLSGGMGSQNYSTNYSQQGLGGQGVQYLGDVNQQRYQHEGYHHKKF